LIDTAADHAGLFAIVAASLVSGFLLGLRFRVLILVPVIVARIVIIVGTAIGLRAAVWPTVLTIILNAFGLQVGYLIGICTAFVLKRRGISVFGELSNPLLLSFDRAAARRPSTRPSDKL